MKTYKPIFIIGSYRGGTSLLFRLLSESTELWSLYRESDFMWQKFFRHPDEKADTVLFEKLANGDFKNLVKPSQIASPKLERKNFDRHYHYSAYSNYLLGYLGRVRFLREKLSLIFDLLNIANYFSKFVLLKNYRFIDKTPPNSYRIEFIKAMYPDAKFIYLVRDKNANIKSLISAWTHKTKFKFAYREYLTKDLEISGYAGKVWKFFVSPGYEDFVRGKSIGEVCEFQYNDVHQHISESLSKLDASDWIKINFEDLLANPDTLMQSLCDFAELNYSTRMQKLVRNMPGVNLA